MQEPIFLSQLHRPWSGPLCGADRNRTDDLLLAKQVLYQLSYRPSASHSTCATLHGHRRSTSSRFASSGRDGASSDFRTVGRSVFRFWRWLFGGGVSRQVVAVIGGEVFVVPHHER